MMQMSEEEASQHKTYLAFFTVITVIMLAGTGAFLYYQAYTEAIIATLFVSLSFPITLLYGAAYFIKKEMSFASQLGDMTGGNSEEMGSDPGEMIEDMVENLTESMEDVEEESEN